MAGEAGDFVHFFMERHAFLQVFELHGAADFRKDGKGIRIPFTHHLPYVNLLPVLDLETCAVNHGIALFFAALVIDNGNRHGTIHYH